MSLDATVGGANANSYLTIADANALLAERAGASDWSTATDPDKEKFLITATRRLDQEAYCGVKANSSQALKWPRYLAYNRDDIWPDEYPFASNVIPLPVKLACAELALSVLRNPELFDDTGLEGFENLSLGSTTITPRQRAAGKLPAQVARFLRGLRVGGDSTVRLMRG